MRRFRSGYTIKYDDDLNPTINFWQTAETLTGRDAEKFIARGRRWLTVLGILFLPLSAVFYLVVGLHNATGWVLEKVMG